MATTLFGPATLTIRSPKPLQTNTITGKSLCEAIPFFGTPASQPSSPFHRKGEEFRLSYDNITFNNSPPPPAMRQAPRLSKKVSDVKTFPKNPLTGEALIQKGGSYSPDPVRLHRDLRRNLRNTGSMSLANSFNDVRLCKTLPKSHIFDPITGKKETVAVQRNRHQAYGRQLF